MLQDISKPSGIQPGGYVQLQACPTTYLSSFPNHNNRVLDNDIVFDSGFDYLTIACIKKSMDFQELVKTTKHGPFMDQVFVAKVAGDRSEILQVLNAYLKYRWIIKVRDNKTYRIIGSLEEPLEFNYSFISGNEAKKLKHYQIKFTTKSKLGALYLPV